VGSAGRPPALSGETSLTPAMQLVVVAVLAGLIATVAVTARWATRDVRVDGHPYVSLYDPPRTRAEAMLIEGDGQAFGALAQDPLLSRPGVFSATGAHERPAQEAAYRAARPLFGWLGWAVSLGRPRAVAPALLLLTVLGAMALAAAVAVVAVSVGRRPDLGVVAVLLPGSLALLGSTGPEALGTALALGGAVLWGRDEREWRRLGIAAMTAGALARETLLIVPLAIALVELRRRRARLILLVPMAALAAWDVVVRLRVGYFPSSAARGRLAAPWTTLAGVAHWSPADALVAAVGVALVLRGWHRLPAMWQVILFGYLALAAVLGPKVWADWWAFSRPLLPLYAIAFVGCLPRASRGDAPVSQAGATFGRAL